MRNTSIESMAVSTEPGRLQPITFLSDGEIATDLGRLDNASQKGFDGAWDHLRAAVGMRLATRLEDQHIGRHLP